MGEKTVTPGSIVTFTIKLKLAPPGKEKSTTQMKAAIEAGVGEESSVEELIGRREKGADGEELSPFAHAPEFPKVGPIRHLYFMQ